jgi:DNA-directed RNA polymerase specialized sigma24 family protein
MLSTPGEVVWALLTYTDWWQPTTSSFYQVGAARRDRSPGDGLRPGLLTTLGERDELSWRMSQLSEQDRRLLYLWYLRQLPAHEIARELRISRRQCFRRRGAAVRTLVELGEPVGPNAASA